MELQIKIAEEEEIEKEEMAKHQKKDEEKFKDIMARRKEILKKDTKPYEFCAKIQDWNCSWVQCFYISIELTIY